EPRVDPVRRSLVRVDVDPLQLGRDRDPGDASVGGVTEVDRDAPDEEVGLHEGAVSVTGFDHGAEGNGRVGLDYVTASTLCSCFCCSSRAFRRSRTRSTFFRDWYTSASTSSMRSRMSAASSGTTS